MVEARAGPCLPAGETAATSIPPDIVDFESFAALPLLTRDLLRDCQADLISRLADPRTRNCLVT